jgi:hypothetical protein
MNYQAKYQMPSGYYLTLDNGDLDQCIRFITKQINIHNGYQRTCIINQLTGEEVLAHRTIK